MSCNVSEKIICDLYSVDKSNGSRSHLGASLIGHSCPRAVWYSYNKAVENKRNLLHMSRLLQTGHLVEERVILDLRKSGYIIEDCQKSYRYKKSAFGGSIDGIIVIDGIRYVLEIKTHSQKSFSDLVKKRVEASKPQHYCQMQVYMHLSDVDKALYLSVNKNTDEIYVELVNYKSELAISLCEKASMIIAVDTPPPRVSPGETGKAWYQCRLCSYSETCYK